MKKYAFIWDLDGTLLDSYDEIVSSILLTLAAFGKSGDAKEIRDDVLHRSVRAYLQDFAAEYGEDFEAVNRVYLGYHNAKADEVTAAPNAEEILKYLTDRGMRNFVFTHREATAIPILTETGLLGYFTEVVTAESGFPRKPAPDAIGYLVSKYGLVRTDTFYVGDRRLDMECAQNAGIGRILYRPPYSCVEPGEGDDYVVTDLIQIAGIAGA